MEIGQTVLLTTGWDGGDRAVDTVLGLKRDRDQWPLR